MTRLLVATILTLAVTLAPMSARANLVELTTWVPLSDVSSAAELTAAIESAVRDAVKQSIAFRPTLVALTNALIVGGKLYVRVLVADEAGERLLGDLEDNGAGPEPTPGAEDELIV